MSWSINQSSKFNLWSQRSAHRVWSRPAHASALQLATGLLLILVVSALLRDVYLLFRYSAAVGVDGYYYVLQIESLYAHRGLLFPTTTPLGLYLLKAIRSWTNDPTSALKLGALAFHLSICLGIHTLVKLVTRSRLYALCGTAIVATSNLHLFFLSEFLSNSVAIACLIWSACFAFLAKQRKGKLAFAGTGLCASIAIFSHRSSIFLLAVFAGSFGLFRLIAFPDSTRSRKVIGWALLATLAFCSPDPRCTTCSRIARVAVCAITSPVPDADSRQACHFRKDIAPHCSGLSPARQQKDSGRSGVSVPWWNRFDEPTADSESFFK